MHADGHDSSSLTRMSLSPPQLRVTAHRTSFFFFFKWVRFRRWAERLRASAKKPRPGASCVGGGAVYQSHHAPHTLNTATVFGASLSIAAIVLTSLPLSLFSLDGSFAGAAVPC